MNEKIYGIDCMKFRKSTHLAGVDVDAIVAEKGECKLTIKEVYYEKDVNVSGNKTDGYFIEFEEDVKPMTVNSTNRKVIANNLRVFKSITPAESRNIGNWKGFVISLYFDPNVKMMGKVTGGIRVHPSTEKETVIDAQPILDKLNKCNTLEELQTTWKSLNGQEQKIAQVVALKDKLKNELK